MMVMGWEVTTPSASSERPSPWLTEWVPLALLMVALPAVTWRERGEALPLPMFALMAVPSCRATVTLPDRSCMFAPLLALAERFPPERFTEVMPSVSTWIWMMVFSPSCSSLRSKKKVVV